MQTSPVPGVWCGAVPTRYRRNPLGFAHAFIPPSRDNIATVNRTASFQPRTVHRPQRTRLRSSPAAASSAEPSPLGPFPRCIPGSWERAQHRFLGFPQAQGWVDSRSHSLRPPHPLGPSRSATAPRPNGRCVARPVAPAMAAVRGIATIPPACGLTCKLQRYRSPSAQTAAGGYALVALPTSPT